MDLILKPEQAVLLPKNSFVPICTYYLIQTIVYACITFNNIIAIYIYTFMDCKVDALEDTYLETKIKQLLLSIGLRRFMADVHTSCISIRQVHLLATCLLYGCYPR